MEHQQIFIQTMRVVGQSANDAAERSAGAFVADAAEVMHLHDLYLPDLSALSRS